MFSLDDIEIECQNTVIVGDKTIQCKLPNQHKIKGLANYCKFSKIEELEDGTRTRIIIEWLELEKRD